MQKWFKILIVPFLVLFLCVGVSFAVTIDGYFDTEDWGAGNYTAEDSPDYQVGPGYGGQAFDVELIGLVIEDGKVKFGLQTGFDVFAGTVDGYLAGDFAFDIGGILGFEYALQYSIDSDTDGSGVSYTLFNDVSWIMPNPYLDEMHK